ncbi:sorting nexin-19 isoform X1 [Stegostoma tigrinum]|uniref:sorting nexin-19 isoform X1 n=1 Tax=Stegostoma tigrinum TaxID=3053191 RepID=UPI00286FDC76|nr:sorting nexin-19 isoform X1 [Stegostoma tigrinum]
MQPGNVKDSGRLLNELLLQRKWLGLGLLVLACLFLQLLLNIWLLCVSVLLVLLGGWLGSQLMLSPTNLVHLERFIRLEPTLPQADSELLLAKEIEGTVTKIIRDFVTSWYRTVSKEPEFENEVQRAMHAMALELKRRMEHIDRKGLAQKILILCSCHLEIYMKAKKTSREKIGRHRAEDNQSLWKIYCKVNDPHIALQSPATEVNYARGIVDLLLHVLVPYPNLETRTGRFVVRELIMCNVLLPVINKMADPDWINGIIMDIFTKSSNKTIEVMEKPLQPIVPTSLPLKPQKEFIAELVPTPKAENFPCYDDVDSLETNVEETDTSVNGNTSKSNEKFEKSFGNASNGYDHQRPDKLNLFYSCEEFEPESPQSDVRTDSTESLTLLASEELTVDRLTPGELANSFDAPEDASGDELTIGESTILDTDTNLPSFDQNTASHGLEHVDDARKEETFGKLATSTTMLAHETIRILSSPHPFQDKEAVPSDGSSCNSLDIVSTGPVHTSSPTSINVSSYSFEPVCSPDSPVVIHNLRISGTVTAKEHRGGGFHPYTLYTIKYETALDTENPGTLQQVAYHTVNRRYSEFLNLQTRLEEKAELRKLLKNVKGPKKLFPDLPFGNMDSDKVEARKSLLETFLKQLCAIPESAYSEEMQEFLALNTDARIAFVKKSFVSRIDKIVVSAIVDTLKTAFPRIEPQSPTEDVGECEVEGKSQGDGKKATKSRLRFTSSKIAPVLNVGDIQEKVTYCYNENNLPDGLSITSMKDFILEKEKLLKKTQINLRVKESKGVAAVANDYAVKKPQGNAPSSSHQDLNSGSETALADVALDLLCLLMKDHWSWLCTENVQKVIRLLCGTLIERWLEVQIINLTCAQHWVVYLRLLQEAIWPGGTLPKFPKSVRTQEQKVQTKELAFQCLMKMLPALVPEILGEEGYKKSWQLVLESLQDPMINRHLVYCIWDLLLEFLIPEASSEEFQKSLLSCASGSSEKLLG